MIRLNSKILSEMVPDVVPMSSQGSVTFTKLETTMEPINAQDKNFRKKTEDYEYDSPPPSLLDSVADVPTFPDPYSQYSIYDWRLRSHGPKEEDEDEANETVHTMKYGRDRQERTEYQSQRNQGFYDVDTTNQPDVDEERIMKEEISFSPFNLAASELVKLSPEQRRKQRDLMRSLANVADNTDGMDSNAPVMKQNILSLMTNIETRKMKLKDKVNCALKTMSFSQFSQLLLLFAKCDLPAFGFFFIFVLFPFPRYSCPHLPRRSHAL